MSAVEAVAEVELICADLDTIARFYGALGFALVERDMVTDPAWHQIRDTTGRTAERLRMTLGTQGVAFLCFDPPGGGYPEGSTASDLWFQHLALVVADLDAAHAVLAPLAASPISRAGPERLPASTGGVGAYKFRDPDGHPLELLHFPAGVGDPRWQAPGDALFRGIDHTAIAVRDARAASRFYGDRLGFRVGRAGVNRGPEQERLDDVPDVVVDVVPLEPSEAATPHVELLGYRTGLRRPTATGPADIAATRTVLRLAKPDPLTPTGATPAIRLANGAAGFALADPDGHRLILMSD